MPGSPMTPERRRAYYLKSRDGILARIKARRQGPDGEAMRAKERAYVDAHREQSRDRYRRYEAAHRERRREKDRAYYEQNTPTLRFKARELSGRRRASRRGATVDRLDYEQIWRDSDRICGECHQLVDQADLHFDHVVAIACNNKKRCREKAA